MSGFFSTVSARRRDCRETDALPASQLSDLIKSDVTVYPVTIKTSLSHVARAQKLIRYCRVRVYCLMRKSCPLEVTITHQLMRCTMAATKKAVASVSFL